MRRFVIGGVLGVFIISVVLAACGGSGGDTTDAQGRRFQDMWEIDNIEKQFHKATSVKDLDLMMSLYAPNATFTVGGGETAVGTDEIRKFWMTTSPAFLPENTWVSDHPAYKLKITLNGDRGTLHFECHYVDPETEKVVAVTAGDMDVSRIDGTWLITNFVGGTTEL
jgi:ketosteroid isomerase-like protein